MSYSGAGFELDNWIDISGLCQKAVMNDLAFVKVQIEGFSFLKRIKSLKYSWSDKLGTIGGTLGLFTGFSFLAVVEIMYWILINLINITKSNTT